MRLRELPLRMTDFVEINHLRTTNTYQYEHLRTTDNLRTTDTYELRTLTNYEYIDTSLVGAGGGFAGFYFFEEPDYAYAEETEEREPAEDVDEGPVGGLAA